MLGSTINPLFMLHRKPDSFKYNLNTKAHFVSQTSAAFSSPKSTSEMNHYKLCLCSIQEPILGILTGAFLSIGFITNFLSLKEMFLISLQGNPIFGVSLERTEIFMRCCNELLSPVLLLNIDSVGCNTSHSSPSKEGTAAEPKPYRE